MPEGRSLTPAELNRYLGLTMPPRQSRRTRLKLRDRQILLMHLEGNSTKEIADYLGCSTQYVREILNCDLAQQVYNDYTSQIDSEFSALYSLSIEAIRKSLRSPDADIALKAAKLFFSTNPRFAAAQQPNSGAEDVIRRILELKITEIGPANRAPQVPGVGTMLAAADSSLATVPPQVDVPRCLDAPPASVSPPVGGAIVPESVKDQSLPVQNLNPKGQQSIRRIK